MKSLLYRLSFVLMLVPNISCGQDHNGSNDINAEFLTKIWYLVDSSDNAKQKKYTNSSSIPNGWGARIEIHENGDFVDAFSTRCGNDQNIHHDKGTWMLDVDRMTLTTTTEKGAMRVATIYKIRSLNSTELVLTQIEVPEQNNRR